MRKKKIYCYHEEWTHLRDSDRVEMEVKEKTQALFKKLGIKTPKRITKM